MMTGLGEGLRRVMRLGLSSLLAFAIILFLAGLPLLVEIKATIPGLAIPSEFKGALSFNPGRILEAAFDWFKGLFDGSSFRFRTGYTEWGLLDLAPGFMVTSFFYLAVPGALGLAAGSFSGVAFRARKRGILDRLADFLLAFPDFLMILALQIAVVGLSKATGVKISVGALGDNAILVLPAGFMTIYPFCMAFRAAADESRKLKDSDYVLYARAKGLPERAVLWRHIGPGIFPRLESELPSIIAFMQGSLYFCEYLFSLPGINKLLFNNAFGGPQNYQYNLVVFALLGSVLACVATYFLFKLALAAARKGLTRE